MNPKTPEQAKHNTEEAYVALSPKLIVQLAAPHTWPAAILPVLFSTALAALSAQSLSVVLVMVLLVICILMQAAVNTLNDYYDFVKGADSIENQDDPTDAVLVYNKVNPRSVKLLALVFLLIAFACGVYVILEAGWIPLVIGLLGAAIIVVYSAGKNPLSYLPVGEFVSAITMGGLIPLACFQALTGTFNVIVLLLSVPIMLGIGLIMFTNNTCDIEKDKEAQRKTQSVLLGRQKARRAYHAVIYIWITAIIILLGIFFIRGLVIIPFLLLILYPNLKALLSSPLTPEVRGQALPQCLNLNIGLGLFYTAAVLFNGVTTSVL